MVSFHIVGLGSLGSTIALEIAKRSLATTVNVKLHLYDFDVVEERNVVAQIFDPEDIGLQKTEAVYRRVTQYRTVFPEVHEGKVTEDNVADIGCEDEAIIVDCVDNLPTRQLLYRHSLSNSTPVLHVGMSTKGMGYVQWNYMFGDRFIDTWSLSPRNINPTTAESLKSEKSDSHVPPCELSSMRTLILNSSMAAVNALFILIGRDITGFVKESTASEDSSGILSSWSTDVKSMNLIPELQAMI